MEVVKGIQIKVARVAAGMTHKDLAEAANVAVSIVRRLEVETDVISARVDTLDKILRSLADKGVTFSSQDNSIVWKKKLAGH